MESHNRGFFRSALHTAHDLIHIAFHPLLLCRLEQDRFTLSTPALFSVGRVEEGSALMLSFLCSPVCIGRIEWGMAPRCGALYGVNGTAVPEGIRFRSFSTKFDGYSFEVNWSRHPVEGPTVLNSSDYAH